MVGRRRYTCSRPEGTTQTTQTTSRKQRLDLSRRQGSTCLSATSLSISKKLCGVTSEQVGWQVDDRRESRVGTATLHDASCLTLLVFRAHLANIEHRSYTPSIQLFVEHSIASQRPNEMSPVIAVMMRDLVHFKVLACNKTLLSIIPHITAPQGPLVNQKGSCLEARVTESAACCHHWVLPNKTFVVMLMKKKVPASDAFPIPEL